MSETLDVRVKMNVSYLRRASDWLILVTPKWETRDPNLLPRLSSRTFPSFRHDMHAASTDTSAYAQLPWG